MADSRESVLEVQQLTTRFMVTSGLFNRPIAQVHAVESISFDLKEGETLSLVGESGCGKTTTGRTIIGLEPTTSGDVYYRGRETRTYQGKEQRALRQKLQMVFQDPRTSLNMKMEVEKQLRESFNLKNGSKYFIKDKYDEEIQELAKLFKIENQLLSTPLNMSGGQRRRFGLAKIMAMSPKIIIADEPVASLDVSIKEQMMKIIFDLNKQSGVTLLIISHDISLLTKHADKICVIDNGLLVESWDTKSKPVHPATIKLLDDSNYVNQFIIE